MLDEAEIKVLIDDLVRDYGYDFTSYARASLRRRINRLYSVDKFPSFAEFRYKLRSDQVYLTRFIEEITVNVTEMFRDPQFYKALRQDVIPSLGTNPFIRIWHAGCSTGEEIYSMAILLKEANLLHKTLLYGTDINPAVLETARSGIFSLSQMKEYSENYNASGGTADFSTYYTAHYDRAILDKSLSEKMVFSTHNLVSDSSFNEFHLVVCRNVLIYFDQNLQERVLRLFDASMGQLSYLALGSKETLKFSGLFSRYKQVSREKIWRKMA